MQVPPVNLPNGNVTSEVPQAGQQPMFPVPTIPVPAVAQGSQGDVVDLHAHLLSQLGRPQQLPQAQMAPFSVGQPHQQQIVTTTNEQQVVSYDNAAPPVNMRSNKRSRMLSMKQLDALVLKREKENPLKSKALDQPNEGGDEHQLRNRRAARLFRQREEEYTNQLMLKVQQLEAKNRELQALQAELTSSKHFWHGKQQTFQQPQGQAMLPSQQMQHPGQMPVQQQQQQQLQQQQQQHRQQQQQQHQQQQQQHQHQQQHHRHHHHQQQQQQQGSDQMIRFQNLVSEDGSQQAHQQQGPSGAPSMPPVVTVPMDVQAFGQPGLTQHPNMPLPAMELRPAQ